MPPGPVVQLTCCACGSAFERKAHRRVRGNVYCSRQCYYNGLTKHPEHKRAQKQATARHWREQNVEHVKRYRREAGLRAQYGISVQDYERMYEAQAGRCGICGEVPERIVVDHCHATGVVRGLLCSPCNVALGGFRDRVDLLDAAKAYLLR